MAPSALLYDLHGNLPALEAVLADVRGKGVERFVLGGDYALFGAFPRETVERLKELDAIWVRGNTDRWLSDAHDAPPDELVSRCLSHCRDRLGDALVKELSGSDESIEIDDVLFCHAAPRSDMLTFFPEPSGTDGELIDDGDPRVIVFGHSHLQFERETADRLLVNPGSVGMPFDGDRRAAYALWDGGRRFELRRVEYDSDAYTASVQRMSATLGDTVGTLVRRLEQAKF